MKIPANATCVYKGDIFEVYEWPQALFDGSVATFEALKRQPSTVVLPVLEDGQIAYSYQEQPGKGGFLGLFGGRTEHGEDPLEAAKRELLEESGLESDDWQVLKEVRAPGKIDWSIWYFVARHCRKVAQPSLDAGEKVEVRTCSFDTFVQQIVPDESFREFELRQILYSGFNPTEAEKLSQILQLNR